MAVQSGDFAESDFYRAQALRVLGRDEEAAKLLRAMEAHGREQCARTQLAFFDGFPTPAPFAATHEAILKSRGMTALAMALAQPMAHLFVGYDAGLFALTVHAFRLFAWSFLLAGFNIFTSGFFTALNNGAVSAAISFLRTLVFQSASVLILPVFFGVDGIWWAITVAEVFAFLISGMFLLLKRNKYHYM